MANGLETKLDEMLVKKAPFQIPENGRKWIATYAWVFELVFVVLGFFVLLPLFAVVTGASVVAAAVGATYNLPLLWLAFLVFLGELVVGAMAVPKLKAMKKSGWNLSYYMVLFNVVYGVVSSLGYDQMFGIVTQLLGSLVSLYILFQIRSYFKA